MVFGDTESVEGMYCMPFYIAQSGDLDRCYRCLTHSQRKDRATQLLIKYKSGALVTQYSATQLVQSLKFRLSHKIIVIKHLTYPYLAEHTSVVWAAVVVIAKKSRKTWAKFVERNWRLDEESDYWGAKKLRGKHLPPG